MVTAIGNVSGLSRQRAIYERYFLPELRPAAPPRVPEMSEESRARVRLAVRAHSAMLRLAVEIAAREASGTVAAAR